MPKPVPDPLAAARCAPQAGETRRLYAADWAVFVAWCQQQRQLALPAAPAAVADYLGSLSNSLRPGALARRAAAIADKHRRAGHPSPGEDGLVRAVLRAARAAGKQTTAARPRTRTRVSTTQLERMAARCPGDLAGLRDRALLLLTAVGLRAEQLLALDREHIRLSRQQAELTLCGEGDGLPREVRVVACAATSATCPVRALDAWLHSSDTQFGPVFRKVDRWGNVEHRRLRADALRRIWRRRAKLVRAGARSAAAQIS